MGTQVKGARRDPPNQTHRKLLGMEPLRGVPMLLLLQSPVKVIIDFRIVAVD